MTALDSTLVWDAPSSTPASSRAHASPKADATTRRILLLGVGSAVLAPIAAALRRHGSPIDCRTGASAATARELANYGCVIVDDRLGERGLMSLLEASGCSCGPRGTVPVIVVTRASEERVRWLRAGAAGTVSRPIEVGEVVARVDRLTVHCQRLVVDARLRVGPIVADPDEGRLELGGTAVGVDRTTFAVLVTLLRAAGNTVPFRVIIDEVWDEHHECEPTIIRPHISRLRRLLGPWGVVSSERGVGYRLEVAPVDGPVAEPR